MTKKKVLFTSHTANFQKFNRPFMRMLAEQGYEVHYASMGEEEILDADKVFTVPFTRSPFKLSNIKAHKQLKEIIDREKYDLIHTHTPMGSVVTRLAAREARKRGTRVIYTAHGFHFFKGAPLLNWILYYPVEKWMAKHTDTLITINDEDFQRAKNKFKNTDVQYVPGVGVDPKRFEPKLTNKQRIELRASLGLKPDDFVMIYPAELNKNKNQTMLIKVMEGIAKESPHVHLLLAGKDSLKGFHAKLIRKKGLEDNIHLTGYRSDIPELLMASDISVSASYREGLPVHIIEAMTAGLPVISTRCRGASELIDDDKNGYLVNFNDTSAMTEKIVDIIHNSQKMGAVNRKKSNAYYLSKITQKISTIYTGRSENPIRILHVVTVMNRAGLETMLMNYYRAIDRTKIQFDFLVHREEKGDYEDEIIALGGRIYRIPSSLSKPFSYHRNLRQFLKKHGKYQIIHSHLDALSFFPLFAARRAQIPMRIAHSHTSSFDRDKKFYVRQILKKFIPVYATHLAGCSSEALRFMFGTSKLPKTIIRNSINVDKFTYNQETRSSVRTLLAIPSSHLVVGHVGRFNYPKNHEFIINIFAQLKKQREDTTLVLIGTGENLQAIQQKATELKIASSVKFLGLREDIPDLMQAMDIFLMPSRYEGLPVVSIEAQAAGLACVFSDAITADLDITNRSSFLSLKEDTEIWTDAILNLSRMGRKDTRKLILEAGYDSATAVKSLTRYYTSRGRGENV